VKGDASELEEGVPAEVLEAERVAARTALRRLHVLADVGQSCAWCGEPYPCPEALLPPEPLAEA
jgi:hypothetical protein